MLEPLGIALFKVRSMFYLLTPTETGSYTSSGPKPDLSSTIGNIFLTFVFAEFMYLYLVHKKNNHLSDVVGNLTSALCLLMTRFSGITSFFMKPYSYCFENYRVFKFSSEFFSSWLGWFACLLLVDLCYYWVHRLSHEINFVWGFHQVHHSSQHYNLTTALRKGLHSPKTVSNIVLVSQKPSAPTVLSLNEALCTATCSPRLRHLDSVHRISIYRNPASSVLGSP